jgi:hypothetical protein
MAILAAEKSIEENTLLSGSTSVIANSSRVIDLEIVKRGIIGLKVYPRHISLVWHDHLDNGGNVVRSPR